MDIKEQIIHEAKKELARRDFWQFCLFYDHDFFHKREFLKQVSDAFMRIHKGESKRISVSMPPRAGKSYITSLFCAWTLGKYPTESVMRNTCTARLYEKFSYDVRGIVKSDKFKEVFPSAELAEDKQSVNGWSMKESRQVGYFGAGVGGTIIGFGATKLAITDDLYKSLEDALSENVNEKVLSWVEATHGSRLEKYCPSIDIGTRWTKKDVIGVKMDHNRYDESIVIRALDENGNSFCEDVKSTKEYEQIKSEIDSIIWLAEYQQEPIESKGLLFPKDELRYFNPNEKHEFETSIAYSDIADAGNDHTSMPVGRNKGKDIYITSWLFSQDISDITIPLSIQACKEQGINYWRVESNSMGAMYVRDAARAIEEAGLSTEIYPAFSSANKHTRILMDAGFVKKNFVFIHPDYQSKEYKKAFDEMCDYTKNGTSKKDDSPDSISGLAMWVRACLPHLYS